MNLLDLINKNRIKLGQARDTTERTDAALGGAFSTVPPPLPGLAPDFATAQSPGSVMPGDMEVATTGQIPRLLQGGMLDVSSGVQNALAAAAQAVGADNVSAAAARSAQLDQERAAKLNPEMMTDIDEIGGEKGGIGTYIGQNMIRGLPTLGAMGLGGVLGGGLKGVAAASAALNTGDAYGQLSAAAKTPEQRAAIPGHAFAAGGFNAVLDTLGFGFAARMAPVSKLALAKMLPTHVLQAAAVEGGTGAAQQYANIVATKHLLENPDLFGLTPEDVHALKNAAAAEASAIAPLAVGGHLAHLPGQLAGQAVEGIQNFRNRGEAAVPEGAPPEGPEGPSFTQRAGDAAGAAFRGDFAPAREMGRDAFASARENIPGVDAAINAGQEFAQRAKPGVDEFMQKARDSATPEGVAMAGMQAKQAAQRFRAGAEAAVGKAADFARQTRDAAAAQGQDFAQRARDAAPGAEDAARDFARRAEDAARSTAGDFAQRARDATTAESMVGAGLKAQKMAREVGDKVRSTADKVRASAANAKRLWDEAQKTQDPNVKKSGFGGKLTPAQIELRKTLHELDPYVPDPSMTKAEQNRLAREHDNAHILTAKTIDSVMDDDRRFDQLLNSPGAPEMLMEQYNSTPAQMKEYLQVAVRRAKDDGREPGPGYDISNAAKLMSVDDNLSDRIAPGEDAGDSAKLMQPEFADALNEHGFLNDSGERNPHMNTSKFLEFLATSKDEHAGTKAGSQVRVAVIRREEDKEPEVAIHNVNLMNLARAWGAGPEGGLPGQREMSVMDKERGEKESKRNILNVVDGLSAMFGVREESTEDGKKVTIEVQPIKAGEGKAPYSVITSKDQGGAEGPVRGFGRSHEAFDRWLPDDAVIGYAEGKPLTWGMAKEELTANAAVSHSSALDQHYKGVSGARWAKKKYGESEAEEDRRIKAQTMDADGKVVNNKYMTDVEMAQKSGADRAVRSIVNDILGGPDGVMMNLPKGEFQRAVNATRKFLDENYDTPIIDRLQEALRSRDRRTAILGRERDEIKVGLERAAKVALPEDLRALLDSTQNEDLSAAYEEALGYVEKGVLAAVVLMPSEIRTAGKAELISQLGRLDARANVEKQSEQSLSMDNPDHLTGGNVPDIEVYGRDGEGSYQPTQRTEMTSPVKEASETIGWKRSADSKGKMEAVPHRETSPQVNKDGTFVPPRLAADPARESTRWASEGKLGPRTSRSTGETALSMRPAEASRTHYEDVPVGPRLDADGLPLKPINTFSGEARGFTRDEEKPPYQSYEKLTKAGQEGMARTKALAAAKDNLRRLYESSEATPSNKKMLRDVRDHFGSYTTQMLTKLADPTLLMSEVRGALKPTKKIPFVGGEPKPEGPTSYPGNVKNTHDRMRAAASAKRQREIALREDADPALVEQIRKNTNNRSAAARQHFETKDASAATLALLKGNSYKEISPGVFETGHLTAKEENAVSAGVYEKGSNGEWKFTPKKAEPAEAPANGKIFKSAYSQKLHDELGNEGFAATHDSPHRFDGKFNWREHSFKGEGAQSFGAGTYLSTANGVHRSYKQGFTATVNRGRRSLSALQADAAAERAFIAEGKKYLAPESWVKAKDPGFSHDGKEVGERYSIADYDMDLLSANGGWWFEHHYEAEDSPTRRYSSQKAALRAQFFGRVRNGEDRLLDVEDKIRRATEPEYAPVPNKYFNLAKHDQNDIAELYSDGGHFLFKTKGDDYAWFHQDANTDAVRQVTESYAKQLTSPPKQGLGSDTSPTYHLSVNAHNHEIMDWDKPFSEQSRHVQMALESLGLGPGNVRPSFGESSTYKTASGSIGITPLLNDGQPMHSAIQDRVRDGKRTITATIMNHELRVGDSDEIMTFPSVEAAKEELLKQISALDPTGEEMYRELSAKPGGDRAASEALQAAGIVGHRYAAGGGKNDVHPNYVIYDDRRIQTNAVEFTGAKNVGSILDTTDPVKQKELIDAIQKITGQKIGVAFDANQAHEGQYDSAKKMVTLAAMTGFSESNAFHEAFHAVSQHYLSSDQRKTLWKAFRQGAIRQQIKTLLKDSPDAWESAKKDPEEMMAYGFQFWHADMLNFGRTPDSTVGKIFHYLLEKFNKVQDWLRDRPGAEELLKSIKDGALADGGPSPVEIAAAKAARPNARIREVSKAIFEGLDKLYDAAVVPYDTRLRDLGNPHIDALAQAMYTQVGEKTGKRGFAQEVPLQVAKRMNVLDKLARGNPRAYAQTLAEKAQGLPETNADMHKAVRGYLAEIEKYAKDAGVVMGHVEDYLPMSWDGNKIAAKRKDFIAMMKNHEMELKAVGFTPEEAADKMSQRGTATGEFVGPIFDENGAPTSDHKLDRVFTFLSNAERAPFVRDDLASSMTRYTKQMVKRAEWARNFGDDNSKWDALVEKAREYGLKKEDEELLNSYKEDAFGLRLHDMNPTARKAVELNTVYQNYRVLSLSLLSNLIDPFGVAVRSGDWGEAWNSYKLAASRMFKSGRLKHAELQELAETIGTIERAGVQDSIHQQYGGVEIEGTARIANDALFRFNGMDGLTRSVRLAGLAAATRFLKHHAGLVGKGGTPRHLDELGIKAGDIQLNAAGQLKVLKEHGLDEATSERVQAALNRFVDEAVLRPNIGERTKWGANPYLAPLYHLKQYVFSFNKVINKKLEHEFVEHDNATPYAMASVYIPIMAMTAMLRDGITHGGELPPNNGFMHYLGSGISRSGLLGPAEQLELAIGGGLTGDLNSVRQLGGPTADQGLDFIHAIANPYNTEIFKRFVKESLPGGNIWEHY